MKIDTRTLDSNIVLDLHGEIDLYNSNVLKETIMENIHENRLNVTLNFEDVKYIDSTGIGNLISCYLNIKNKNGRLKIINLNGSVQEVFRITKLLHYFDLL